MGLFTLVACSSDAYDVTDQQNKNAKGMKVFTDDGIYLSSWDINTRNTTNIEYRFENNTNALGPAGRLEFRVTPYVGLAYYDGNNDGVYNDNSLLPASSLIRDFTSAAPGAYPNLYPVSPLIPSPDEIGNFIAANPFTLDGSGLGPGSQVLEIGSANHCPTLNANITSNNPAGVYFNLSGTSTSQEDSLLADYGKVFYYFWEAIDPVTNTTVLSGYVTPYCNTSDTMYWANSLAEANPSVPGLVNNVFYNISSNGSPNPSDEIVLPVNAYPHQETHAYSFPPGSTYYYTVTLTTNSTGVASVLSLSIDY